MSTTSSKFSIENFDPTPDDELICSICRCIFDDPMECPCRHIFCRSCISSWLELKRSCPICRKHVDRLDLQSVVPLIKNMIGKLTMICPNRDNGCKTKITLDNYNLHVSCCIHEIIACKNNNCSRTFLRKDMEKHEKVDCEFRMVMCERDCKLMLPLAKVKQHSCIKELKQQLEESAKREQSLNKHIEELTNELNTLKKKSAEERRNPYIDSFFSLFSSDDASNSFADSFMSSESDSYLSDSRPSFLEHLQTRLSNLSSTLSIVEDSLTSNVDDVRSRSSGRQRESDVSLEIISDQDNNNQSRSNYDYPISSSSSRSHRYDSDDLVTDSESSESSVGLSRHESAEGDDDFPTLAQRRILKRKRSSSVVSVSSESEQTEPEMRVRRRRSGDQNTNNNVNSNNINNNHNHSASGNSSKNRAGNNAKSRTKRNNARHSSTTSPRSIVPVEVPSNSSILSNATVEATSPRANGLERTRELLELFSVETDPDWEPSEYYTTSEGEEPPVVRSVPAAQLLDSMMSDDDEQQYHDHVSSSDLQSDDENYEVLVPERTFDLLVRYSQEDSEEDEEWLPSRLRQDTSDDSDVEWLPR